MSRNHHEMFLVQKISSFSVGNVYRATKQLFKILKRANSEAVIVDEYLDDTVFDYIESLDPVCFGEVADRKQKRRSLAINRRC